MTEPVKFETLAVGTPEWLDEVFQYHAPTPELMIHYQIIRAEAKALVASILAYCPPSADRTAAIRLVREAVMTANASIALHGLV